MMFKAVVCIAIGLVIGFALGGLSPRRELESVRSDRDALRTQLAHAARPSLLHALLPRIRPTDPEVEREGPVAPAQGLATTASPDAGAIEARPATTGDVVVIGGGAQPARDQPPVPSPLQADVRPNTTSSAQSRPGEDGDEASEEDTRGQRFLGRFDQLVTAQRARTAAARSALIEQAGLDDAQIARVDTSVQKMNAKLAGYGEEVIAQAASDEPPSPAQALGLGHDVSGILYEGQKELDSVVGDKDEAIDPSALEIWSYIDLAQWTPYVEEQLAKQSAQQPTKQPTK